MHNLNNSLWSSGRVGVLRDQIQQDKMHGHLVTLIVQVMIHCIIHQWIHTGCHAMTL